MSFESLKVDELKAVAGFFAKDVEAAKPEKPTKKELIAALASDDGQGPVTWEEYETAYLPVAKAMEEQENLNKEPEPKAAPSPDDEVDETDKVLIIYTGNNPTWPALGYSYTKRHPFHAVSSEHAEWLVKNQSERFRVALPSEINDYYA